MAFRIRSTSAPSGAAMRIIPLVFLVLGGVLLVAAVVVAIVLNQASAQRTESTAATVVEVTERTSQSRDGDGNLRTTTNYCPTVEYVVGGETFQVESDVCTGSREGNEVGDELDVNYNPADPSDAAIDSWTQRWLTPLILGGVGATFVLVGSAVRLVRRSGKGNAAARPASTQQQREASVPDFHQPDFPPARPGTHGYDVGAVDVLVSRIERAYADLAAGHTPSITAAELGAGQLARAGSPGEGYDTATVEMYLDSVRTDLERAGH